MKEVLLWEQSSKCLYIGFPPAIPNVIRIFYSPALLPSPNRSPSTLAPLPSDHRPPERMTSFPPSSSPSKSTVIPPSPLMFLRHVPFKTPNDLSCIMWHERPRELLLNFPSAGVGTLPVSTPPTHPFYISPEIDPGSSNYCTIVEYYYYTSCDMNTINQSNAALHVRRLEPCCG